MSEGDGDEIPRISGVTPVIGNVGDDVNEPAPKLVMRARSHISPISSNGTDWASVSLGELVEFETVVLEMVMRNQSATEQESPVSEQLDKKRLDMGNMNDQPDPSKSHNEVIDVVTPERATTPSANGE